MGRDGGKCFSACQIRVNAGDFSYEKQGALKNDLVCCRPLVI